MLFYPLNAIRHLILCLSDALLCLLSPIFCLLTSVFSLHFEQNTQVFFPNVEKVRCFYTESARKYPKSTALLLRMRALLVIFTPFFTTKCAGGQGQKSIFSNFFYPFLHKHLRIMTTPKLPIFRTKCASSP